MSLSREQIIGSEFNTTIVEVPIPQLGGSVFVKKMNSKAREGFIKQTKVRMDQDELSTWTIVTTCCDENGKLLFTVDDVSALNEKDPGIIDLIFNAALELNKKTLADNAVEIAVKN